MKLKIENKAIYPASDINLEISLAETNTACNDTLPLTNLTLPISPIHVMATNPTLPISPFHVMATNPILMTSQYIAQRASPVTTQVNKTAADSLNMLNVCLEAGNFEFKNIMLNSKSTPKSNKRAVGTFRQYLTKQKLRILIK
jgi:hypothetical protein